MLLHLNHIQALKSRSIKITGSKSETNRLLMLQALFSGFDIQNGSNSDDGAVMKKALQSNDEVIDIHHAGTAMRFLTAYFSVQKGRETLLTGSHRMQERPIKILVDALRSLGAQIEYQKNEGFPPIKIIGQKITQNKVTLQANVSSQYISALMLIAPSLEKGLTIHLEGKITSVPYINMTLSLLHQIGVQGHFIGQEIVIAPFKSAPSVSSVTVESDWSSVSYFYSIVALLQAEHAGSRKRTHQIHLENEAVDHSNNPQLVISSYKEDSLQGDACLQHLYKQFGVQTSFEDHKLILSLQADFTVPESIEMDLAHAPDIAQTIAVTCLGLGVGCTLTGLHTLKIKETDRLEALKTEISKLGGTITVTNDTLLLKPQKEKLQENISIATYHDHRMAMAFAPLALCTSLQIEDAGVVSKSYPDFWEDLKRLGFSFEIIG